MLEAEFNEESSHLEIGTHVLISQGMCSDLQDKEVEVYLLNSSFEKVQRRA